VARTAYLHLISRRSPDERPTQIVHIRSELE
jgi:hypothetical protein